MMNNGKYPPKFIEWIIAKICPTDLLEDILGDMEEEFYHDLRSKSLLKAQWKYIKNGMSLIFSYAIKKRKKDHAYSPFLTTQNNTAMLKNYFIIAMRNLRRNLFFTSINTLGLAFGMSITILYLGFLTGLYRYDKFHENYDRIYRIVTTVDKKTEVIEYASSPAPLADELNRLSKGIEKTVNINDDFRGDIDYQGKQIAIEGFYTQPSFFEIFSFDIIKGNPQKSLEKPFQLILTSSSAYKLFGEKDPIGEVITYGENEEYVVSGIIADPPKGSHLIFDALASYSTLAILERDQKIQPVLNNWSNLDYNYTYFITDNQSLDQMESILQSLASSQYENNAMMQATFDIQPLSDVVMGWKNYNNDIGPYFGGPPVIGFGVFTLLILLPACFNYSSISISRSLKRSKEIGIRKVVGGHRSQIKLQFIIETVIISLAGLIGSFIIFLLIKDGFTKTLANGDTVDFSLTPQMILIFVFFAILTGIVAGLVPAGYFSRIKPINALKSSQSIKILKKSSLKRILIIAQFSISLFFIIGVLVQLKQTRYSLNFEMGFARENLLNVDLKSADDQLFRNEFSKQSGVSKIAMASHIIGTGYLPRNWAKYTHKDDSIRTRFIFVDNNYIENLNLNLVAGANFNPDQANLDNLIVINETFSKNLGFDIPEKSIGTSVIMNDKELTIIGVIQDFNYELLRVPISNLMMLYDPDKFSYAVLKVNNPDKFELLSDLEKSWENLGLEDPLHATFFDQDLEEAFKESSHMVKIYAFMGIMAIIVASLGLLGMVVYSTESRIKEVGVRKIMGASISQIILLLSGEYIKLMVIACLFSIPISYFTFNFLLAMEQHYSVTVGLVEILLGIGFLFIIGLLTMSTQTFNAARANPADTLRYE